MRHVMLRCPFSSEDATTAMARTDEDGDPQADFYMQMTRLPLGGLNITAIDNTELFSNVTHLELQNNAIERIEHLEAMPRLRFLALFNNRISVIAGLMRLRELAIVDLSANRIASLGDGGAAACLPDCLLFVDLRGNACTQAPDYFDSMLDALPHLAKLDGQDLGSYSDASSDGEADDGPASCGEPHDEAQAQESERIAALVKRMADRCEAAKLAAIGMAADEVAASHERVRALDLERA